MYVLKFLSKFSEQKFWLPVLVIACFAALTVSCNGNENGEKEKYDPSKPTTVSDFYPTEGLYQEKVLLNGTNLPTDPEMVRVYFNQRRAPVIGSTTGRMFVLAPRLPGNAPGMNSPGPNKGHCVISLVVIGPESRDSMSFRDTFVYEESITVSTIAGNGDQYSFKEGPLATSIMQPRYVCADNEGNIFISNWRDDDNRDFCYFCRLNEEENVFMRLWTTKIETNIPAADPMTGIVAVATESSIGSFITANPDEYWAPRQRTMKFMNGNPAPYGWKHCMVVNPTDGQIYVRWYQGPIVRINPTTYEAMIICTSIQGDSYGLTFRPQEPDILYISFWDNAAEYSRSIVSVNVGAGRKYEDIDPLYQKEAKDAVQETMKRRSSNQTGGGHRDGPLESAQFGAMGQIFCDADGFIYVADRSNHCIRRITPENQVETVLGIPGIEGWRDGTRDEALFRRPTGVAISKDGSVYVADRGNSRLRKLSVN